MAKVDEITVEVKANLSVLNRDNSHISRLYMLL